MAAMGTSDGGEGGSVVDCAVGTIVWVRRRNGSWWPGRILGPEELAASHLMSPRSGTPVKLLGREDASVDWYNLEKSKRVKAFRCGEFDACIERAEASQGIPIKKREKYARREDAILHALELEKQQLGMKHHKLGTISNGTNYRNPGSQRRELHSFSSDIYSRDDDTRVHSKYANHKSHMLPRKAVSSGEDENKGNSMYVQKGKTIKQSGWEEYNSESLPRMRGPQDFGLRIAPPKKKVSTSVAWGASQEPVDIHMDALSRIGHMVGDPSNTSGCKSSFAIKRKRPQGCNGEASIVKKRDTRRPLHQVLQSSMKLPASHSLQAEYDSGGIVMQGEGDNMGSIYRVKRSGCLYLPADSNDSLDDNGYPCEEMPDTGTHLGIGNFLDHRVHLAAEYSSSGLAEETESDSSETDYLESDSEEDGNLTDTTQALASGPKECEQSAVQVSENFGDLSDDETPLFSYIPPLPLHDQMMVAPADAGVSKWHMKGKRNIRNVAKRPIDLISSNVDKCNGHLKGTSYERMGGHFKMRSMVSPGQRTPGQGFYRKKDLSHFASDGVNMMENDMGNSQILGQGTRRYSFAWQGSNDRGRSYTFNDSDDDSHLLLPPSWGADGLSSRRGRRAFWEESDARLDPNYADYLGDEMEYMLVDVDIQVQKQSYRGEHVPWVSLSSKGNGGKPVLGHPVQIEILEDGWTDHLISKYDDGLEESSMPHVFMRTAKRTVMHRIPRSNPAASAFDDEADPLYSDEENKTPPKKAYTGYFNNQARLAKKSNSNARRPTMQGGTFQKTLLNKGSLSSKKTRTLSSLATEKRLGGGRGGLKRPKRNDILDGLIRPEGGIPPVTCVPVKVVFSRILEAVGRPLSISARRARLASPAARGVS